MRMMAAIHLDVGLRMIPTLVALLVVLVTVGLAQERDRSKIPDKYKWNLADIYANDAAWREAKDRIAEQIPSLGSFQGKLMSSPATLADALERLFALQKELSRASAYASMLSDQDTRDGRYRAMSEELVTVRTALRSQTAFFTPEILDSSKEKVEEYIAAEPRLKKYQFYLEQIIRRRTHTLSQAEERLLALVGPVSRTPSNTYTILANADFPYPTVSLSDGRSVKLDKPAYEEFRSLPNRADRETVMSSFFRSMGDFSRTFGTMINGEAQNALFAVKARKYPSALEMALDGPNIPVSVYDRLVDGVNRNLPTFHRYLKLRKRMLGLDQLHYYDLYAPLVSSVNLTYTPEEAQKHVLAALAPLGSEYISTVQRAFDERWVDLFPNEGKVSGAYSSGSAFDVHPYVLLNFNGKYGDVSTLAHELGHTMHSYFSNKTQPYPTAGYPIFVAEVASTFNESLLIDYMLKNITDADTRLALLGNYLENIKGTVFRQTQFAEFELRLHEMVQKGQPIVGDTVGKLYLDITKKYYGHDEGICVVDDYVINEWSMVPHFYSEFYVYQYATSFTASEALAAKVKSGDAAALKRYLSFLSSGGSKYPIDLLKDAGIDMTTDEPLDLTIQAMNRTMDEMERLLDRR